MNIKNPILDKIYNIYSNILKIKNGIIYNKDKKDNKDKKNNIDNIYNIYNKVEIEYKNKSGILCKIVINIIIFDNNYHFEAVYYEGDIIESYFNNKIRFHYYYNKMNNDLLFINTKNTQNKSIVYNKNKNICYKYIYCNSYEIKYKDKNNKIINLNNRTKNKKFNNKILYLIKLIIINYKYSFDFILFKYYIFNNYYIYCLKCNSNKYKYKYNYDKIKNYYIYKYLFIIFI